MVDEAWIDYLEKTYQETRQRNKQITEYVVKESRRRRRAILTSGIILAIVSTVVACINIFIRLNPIILFAIGLLVGSITMQLCIWIFKI